MEKTKELHRIDAVGAGNACRRIALTLKHGNKFESAYQPHNWDKSVGP
jgi:hypothetical protein